MRLWFLPLFLLLLLCSISAVAQTVFEPGASISIEGTTARITLPVDTHGRLANIPAAIELTDPSGAVRARSATNIPSIEAGRQTIKFELPIGDILADTDKDIAWYRLHYRIGDNDGVMALSQLVADLFEMRIIAGEYLLSGTTYRVRIRATNPFTERPAAGVSVKTKVLLDAAVDDNSKLTLSGSGVTDSEGFTFVDLTIPPETKLGADGRITVTGIKNGIVREAEEDLRTVKQDVEFLAIADKPIYQPEQMLNFRGILIKGSESKTVVVGSQVEFRVSDEDDTVLYREKVLSSEFGIASFSWRIPANAKLGDYRISVRGENGEEMGGQNVKVSRYDLPNFAVEAKAAKPYYLPGETFAEVEVKADYLFGKPVTSGTVRVVQEDSREWNWKEQKYDISEGKVHEGHADANGKFTAQVDLSDAQRDLKDEEWREYEDTHFAAYFTDLTTNQTEQRRFDIRISKEPVHVYLISDTSHLNPKMPVNVYVSSFYADGTPAECDVQLRVSEHDKKKFKTVGRFRTNSFGAGKLSTLRPNIGDSDDTLDLFIIAKDKNGLRGTTANELSFDDDVDQIQVAAAKTIYKPGESIRLSINSTIQSGPVYIDIVSGWTVIDSRQAVLKDGQAELQVPYMASFKGELKLSAFTENPKDEIVKASKGIIFPSRQAIAVTSDLDKTLYKPGEDVTAKFGVTDAAGGALQSALGIVVLDKAVEERARTDADFGGYFRGFGAWLGYGSSFGGVNVKDLNEMDLTKPISAEMQLVAEMMLLRDNYFPQVFHSNRYFSEAKSVFKEALEKQFAPVAAALRYVYLSQDYRHPIDDASLNEILSNSGIRPQLMTDPWGTPFRAKYTVEKDQDVTSFVSAGPDEKFETKDDFTAFSKGFQYFAGMGKAIDLAAKEYNARTGRFIRDEKTLLAELGLHDLRDRFGRPYDVKFEPEGRHMQIRLRSSGPDGKFDKFEWRGDDFTVWTSKADYFATAEAKIADLQKSVVRIPLTESEFRMSLKNAGVDLDQFVDGWGHPPYVLVNQTSRFWDKVTIETVRNFGEANSSERRVITPVTQQIIEFTIRSGGADGKNETSDDFTLTKIVHVIAEKTKDDPKAAEIKPAAYIGSFGSIAGTIRDAAGAVIPGVSVTATNIATLAVRKTVSYTSGEYLIPNLVDGKYSVQAESAGFQKAVVEGVQLAGNTTTVDIVLSAGGANSVVTVSGDGDTMVDATSAKVQTSVTPSMIESLPKGTSFASLLRVDANTGKETSTPRVREYFPETLLWQPELVTGTDGKVELRFKTADNITTWKMYTIASTRNGQVGVAEKEFTAFQALFADLDPPKFLTASDEIYLPAQVRNYTDRRQKVDVSMDPASWFSMLTPAKQQVDVESNRSKNAVFGFKVTAVVKDGKQRVTAAAESDSDAIEKPVTVRPNGQEIVRTNAGFGSGEQRFDLTFPANALSGSQKAELKIFPNLYSHVTESVEGLLRRPYGCGEQTISSTYPNLMILKFVKPEAAVAKKARTFLQKGYERLLGYQAADGGFTYWGGKEQADIALTAYAIRFLSDARSQIAVDEDVIKRASGWLVKQQRPDGSWSQRHTWETIEDVKRTKILTTYIARSLAMNKDADQDALKKVLDYLRARNNEIDEPYSMALYGLASLDAGDNAAAAEVAKRLEAMAIGEGDGVYWSLETNTPFYGWGTAGRIETTALVTHLLVRIAKDSPSTRTSALIGKGMTFLLKNKDRYAVWYSTQTTINVLDAFLAAIGNAKTGAGQQLNITLNGRPLQTVDVASDQIEPVVLDLTGKLEASSNSLEVRSSSSEPIMAQTIATHYIDWKDADLTGRTTNRSRALDLSYKCDKSSAAIMEDVNCSVSAERVGFQGYGMLLAEIGIPPGADVSRESLETAVQAPNGLSRYDVLPDRIIVYMWSSAGGTRFNFKFKPRYAINALTPASTVYDYYNPEAQAVAAPLRFVVK